MVYPSGLPSRRPSPGAGAQASARSLNAGDRVAAGLPQPAAIAHGYDYLARIWLDGPLRLSEAALQAWLPGLPASGAGLARRWSELVRLLDLPGERTGAEEDYQACLVIPQPGRYVPPYASAWLDGAEGLWGQTTARVLTFYQEAGLGWAAQQPAGHGRSWVRAPDHLGVECAFVAELAAAEPADARAPARMAVPAAMAAEFLAGHMRRWIPAYAGEFARQARSRYWRGMAGVLAAWVRMDAFPRGSAGGDCPGREP